MGYDVATLEQQLQLIQDMKLQILNQGLPGIQVSSEWKIGEVTMKRGGAGGSKLWMSLPDLIKAEKDIMEMLKTMFPTEQVRTAQDAITPFGHDETDYEGEERFDDI